jgi:hypothetical protein
MPTDVQLRDVISTPTVRSPNVSSNGLAVAATLLAVAVALAALASFLDPSVITTDPAQSVFFGP